MKKRFKQLASLVLAFSLLFGCLNIGALSLSASGSGSQATLTDSQLIAKNYESVLSSSEKEVLASSALAGTVYTYTAPSDEDNLVSINKANKTIAVSTYNDGANVWKPISAKIVAYNSDNSVAAEQSIALDASGAGSFSGFSHNSYRVYVDYVLTATVDTAAQQLLLNASAYLAGGIINMNKADDLKSHIQNLSDHKKDLYRLVTPGIQTSLGKIEFGDAAKTAMRNLFGDKTDPSLLVNEDDKCLAAVNAIQGYAAAANKISYLLANGKAVKESFEFVRTNLVDVVSAVGTIETVLGFAYDSLDANDKKVADDFRVAAAILKSINTELQKIKVEDWAVLDQTLVKSTATATELQSLNTAILATITKNASVDYSTTAVFRNDIALKNELTVAAETVSAGVDQYKVNVEVKAKVMDRGSENTATPITLTEVGKTTLILDKDTAKDAIESAVNASGVITNALSLWSTTYNIGTEYYTVEFSGVPTTLTSDVTVTVTYTPKTYTVNLWGTDEVLPYGYRMRLPVHADSNKSYDYRVAGELYRQDTIYTVEGAATITREEGKATERVRIPAVVASSAKPGNVFSAEEKALLNQLSLKANDLWYRTPDQSLGLVTVALKSSNEYEVKAEGYASGLLSGAQWVAKSFDVKSADNATLLSGTISAGVGTFTYAGSFDRVEVRYELVVTDVSASVLSAVANIPHELVEDAANQKSVMHTLATGDLYSGLSQVKASDFNIIKSMALGYSVAAQNAVDSIITNGIRDGEILLKKYLDEYRAGGLAYFYTRDNAEKIANQVELLADALTVLWADPGFQNDLATSSLSSYSGRLENLKNTLNATTIPNVSEFIDTYSDTLSSLVTAIENATGHTQSHTVSSDLVLATVITGDAPDKASVTVKVEIVSGKGIVTSTESKTISFPIGTTLSAADIQSIANLADSVSATLGVDKTHYQVSTTSALNAGDTLNSSVVISYKWTPVSYTVKIAGEADQVFFADSDFVIKLPAYAGSSNNIQYSYMIGTQNVIVAKTEGSYRFASLAEVDALFGADRTLTVTRTEIDAYREKLLSFVNELNVALAKGGLTFTKGGKQELLASFIPMEDASGKITIVLRVFPEKVTPSVQTLLADVVRVLTSPNYLGINGEALWDGKLSVQTIVNAVLSSEFGLDSLTSMIDADGKIADISTSLAAFSPIGAVGGEIVVQPGKSISHLDMLGGKLFGGTLQIGDSATDNLNADLYITIADLSNADLLKRVDSAAGKVQSYITANFSGGAMNLAVNIPDSVYPFFLTGMLVLGYVDIADVQDLDLAELINYEYSVMKTLLTDPNFSLETVEKSLAKLGKNVELSQYATVLKAIRHAMNNGELTGTSIGNVYSGTYSYDLRKVLNTRFSLDDTILNLIKEDKLTFNLNLEIENLEKDYEALVIDYKAGLTKIVKTTTDLASALTNASQNTVVILLKNVNVGSVTIGKTVHIDLNGYTLTGDIASTANVTIFDSTLDMASCGTIDGTLTGNFTISGGKFTTDVTPLLKKGYVQNASGIVHNTLYTIEKSGNDIKIVLAGNFLARESVPNVKTFALDVVADLINIYQSSTISVDGNVLYCVAEEDVTSFIGISTGEFLDTALGYLNTAGISATVNAILSDLTNFGALKAALESNSALMSYTLETKPWDITFGVKNDYLTAGIGSKDSGAKVYNVQVVLDPAATAAQKKALIDLVSEMDQVLTVNEMQINLTDLGYSGRFAFDGNVTLKAKLDLASKPQYAAVIAVSVASVTARTDYKTELVSALTEYLTTAKVDALKAALDKVTTAEAIAAVKKVGNDDFGDMLTALGLTAPNLVEFEAIYDGVLGLASAALGKLGFSGGSRTLSEFESTYGIYEVEENAGWTKFDILLTVALLEKDPSIAKPEIQTPSITISTNDALIRGAKVDVLNSRIFLDIAPSGMKVSDISRVAFSATNGATITVVVTDGTNVRAAGDLICNGDIVKITATNAAGTTEASFTIIIAGDVNGNGVIDAGDAVRMANYYVNAAPLSAVALLAADMNQNGDIDAGDAVKNATKYVYAWEDNSYESKWGK